MPCANRFGLAAGLIKRTAAPWVCGLGFAAWSAVASVAQDEAPTLHVYTNLVQIPTLVIDQDAKPLPAIAESRFFVSLDGGPKFRVTHVRPEGDDPISLAIVLDVGQPFPRLMANIDDAIAGLAPLSLHAKDRVSVYSMGCNLGRSADNVPADAARLHRDVDFWRSSNGRRMEGTARRARANSLRTCGIR